jgi:hypothetical protein
MRRIWGAEAVAGDEGVEEGEVVAEGDFSDLVQAVWRERSATKRSGRRKACPTVKTVERGHSLTLVATVRDWRMVGSRRAD